MGNTILELKNIVKTFPGVLALNGIANSHFPRPAGPHFPASQGHIKRSALEIGRARGAPPC